MGKKRAGWERVIYYGTANTTASTHINDNVSDIDIGGGSGFVSTTDRGDGTAPPHETEQLISLKSSPSFKMQYVDGDAHMIAMLAAHRTGTGKAFKILRHLGGEVEFDGDCYVDYESPGPLAGGMEVTFTLHPTDDYGRTWTTGGAAPGGGTSSTTSTTTAEGTTTPE